MKKLCFMMSIFLNFFVYGQNDLVIDIQELKKPENLLYENYTENVFKDMNLNPVASSLKDSSYVNFGDTSLLLVFKRAYRDHRPIVISPDVIWLLISQGFARHISNNSERLRYKIVPFNDKKSLYVSGNDLGTYDNIKWDKVCLKLEEAIANNTNKDFAKNFVADFSTTTVDSKIASQITLFESVNKYFDYILTIPSCGIPKVTVKGTLEDWQKIEDKLNYIEKFDLSWWTSELKPIIKQIIESKQGNIDLNFWKNIITFKEALQCGEPEDIDGWLCKFYPFGAKGERMNLNRIKEDELDKIAPEFVKVPFEIYLHDLKKRVSMEFFAGIVGVKQNKDNFALEPEIGWVVSQKNKFSESLNSIYNNEEIDNLIIRDVNEVPFEILNLKKIDMLEIHFINYIRLSDELKNIRIKKLKLFGKFFSNDLIRLKRKFLKTELIINNKKIQ